MNTNNTMHSKKEKMNQKSAFYQTKKTSFSMCSGGRRCESGPDPIRLRRKPETIAETDERIYYNQRNRRIWRRIWRQRHWIRRLQPWQLRRVLKKNEKRRTVQPEMKLKAKRSFVFFGFIKQRGKCWFFALEAPEGVMEWAMETKSLGGLFELELTDQICGTNFFD